MRYVVRRQLVQHVLGHAVHDALSGGPRTAAALLGLDVGDGVQHLGRRISLIAGSRQTTKDDFISLELNRTVFQFKIVHAIYF